MAKYFKTSLDIIINVSSPKQKSDHVPKVPHQENISKEGWIQKKSKHLKNYRERFMQLNGDKLLCYKSDKFKQTNESATEIFDLSLHVYRLEIHENVKEKFYLINESLKSNSRTFKAETESERNDWVNQIRNNIKNIDNISKNDNKLIKKKSPLFETIEIQMEHKTDTEMNDSDSENSDDDFGGYGFSFSHAKSLNIKQSNMLQPRKHTISRRKSNIPNSELSFSNFRIRSLTVVPKNSQITNNTTVSEDKMNQFDIFCVPEEKEELKEMKEMSLESNDDDYLHIDDDLANAAVLESDNSFETKENDVNVEDMIISDHNRQRSDCMIFGVAITCLENEQIDEKVVLTPLNDNENENENVVYDETIIAQLMMFGYERDEIINVMESVVNPNNINQIREKLDEKTDADEQAIIDVQMQKNVDDKPMTPAIELCDPKKAKQARLRKCILQEIVSTEETYVDGLDTLLNELIQPIFDYSCVDKKYYKQVRSSLPKIFDFHRGFLRQLNNNNNESLPSVFNKCIKQNKEEFIDKYLEFVNDYDKILDLFGKTFHGNFELEQFLLNKRKEGKPLSGFLILPVQRVPRYILLLTDLQKNTDIDSEDYNDIKDAVEMIKDITQEINERKKKIENLSQCLQIQEALNGLMEPIVNDNRIFIEQFIFIKATIKHQRLFFLFNDAVIIANEKWKVKHILDIRTLEVKIIRNNQMRSNNQNGKANKLKRKQLSEFQLISVGFGSVDYIGENINIVNKFKNLIGKWRVKLMTDDVRQRNETLGCLRDELGRQAKLYDK